MKFMSSGPSHVLVLTKGQADDSIVKDWRDMLGPPVVENAKEQAPERCMGVFSLVLRCMHLSIHKWKLILPAKEET